MKHFCVTYLDRYEIEVEIKYFIIGKIKPIDTSS